MSPDNTHEGGSLFASIRGLGEPEKAPPAPAAPVPSFAPAPAATPPVPAVDLQPLQERLERIEKGMAAARQHDPAQRIAELERQLKQTQEQAVGALVTLREREEAQKAAQRDMEALLKNLSSQRRSEELDRQMRDRIAELESRILAVAKAEPREPRPDPAILSRLEALEAESARAAAVLRETVGRALDEIKHVETSAVQAFRAQQEESGRASEQARKDTETLRVAVEMLRREISVAGADSEEKIAQLRVDLAAKEASRAARVEDLAALVAEARTGLAERLAALGRELSELRSAQRESIKEISASVEAAAAARLEEVSVRVDKSLGEGLLGVRSRLDGIDAELEQAACTHTLLAETTARVEQVRNEAEWKRLESLKRLEDFQTEVRAVILGRLLRLEAALGIPGRDA